MKLEDFVEEISSLGISEREVIGFLIKLYAAKEIPYEVEIKPDYHSRIVFEVEDWIIELLRKYGVLLSDLSQTSLYGKHAIVRFHRFTEEGFKLGREAFRRHLKEVYPLISDHIEKYPANFVRVLSLCSMNLDDGHPCWLNVKTKGFDLNTAISRARIDLEVSKLSQTQLSEKCKVFSHTCRGLIEELIGKWDAGFEVSHIHYYDIYLSKFLLEYDGRVLKEANELMDNLSDLGVAVKIPIFDTKGKYLWDSYRAPPEIACLLYAKSIKANLSEFRGTFLSVDLLNRAMYVGLKKGDLLEKAKNAGVSEVELKLVVNLMYQRGLTTKYNDRGGPNSPAFIILDKDRVLEELEIAVSQLEDLILSV